MTRKFKFGFKGTFLVFILLLINLGFYSISFAKVSTSFSGDIDIISSLNFKGRSSPFQLESPFLPSATFDLDLKGLEPNSVSWNVDALISYKTLAGDYLMNTSKDIDFKQYRLWLRYLKNKIQIRAGRQKMIFGHAKYFRPLSIFDNLNPQDSAGVTRGEKSILFKYYPDNNWGIQSWLVYNDNLTRRPHPGLRVNRVMKFGETAFTWHQWNHPLYNHENIMAVDAFFDNEMSYWLEFANHDVETGDDYFEITLGTDYTFQVGNGLHAGVEFSHESGQSLSQESDRAVLFFDMPITDYNTLYGSFFYNRQNSAKGFNIRLARNMADNLYSELYFNWSDMSFQQLLGFSNQSRVFFENIIALRVRYSF